MILVNEILFRKNEAIQQRKKIMESQYIENEINFFFINIQKLMQADMNRHARTMFLINCYYDAFSGKTLSSFPDLIPLEISEVKIIK